MVDPAPANPRLNLLFAGFVVLEIVAFYFVPFLPLVVPAIATFTRLSGSRWRLTTLWVLAAASVVVVLVAYASRLSLT